MAVQSFYISVKLGKSEKRAIQSELKLQRDKSGDLIYRDTLCIDNITLEAMSYCRDVLCIDDIDYCEDEWWHINACFYNFFYSCEVLYELCQVINKAKPQFEFILLGKSKLFNFTSFFDFLQYVYVNVKPYKENFESNYGNLSVHPKVFFAFRRKNKKFFK